MFIFRRKIDENYAHLIIIIALIKYCPPPPPQAFRYIYIANMRANDNIEIWSIII